MDNKQIIIRKLTTADEMKQIQKLEKIVWNNDPVPINQIIAVAQNGGLILGAFLEDRLVGFNYGFSGFNKGHSYLCSHILAIDSNYRDKGIGASLKHEQSMHARQMGYDLIVWTYDPLEARNGYLNLSKLGAICSNYVDNCYGDMGDSINRGMPSDRFKVEWWITSPNVKQCPTIVSEKAQTIFDYELTEEGLPKLLDCEAGLNSLMNFEQPILVPIPVNFQEMKQKNKELAIEWRFKTRAIFQTLFAKGYAAVAIIKGSDELVHHYLLVQKHSLQIGDVK